MPTTPNRAYRYPASTDPPNGPLQLQQLAEDIDADVQNLNLTTVDGVMTGTYAGQPIRRKFITKNLTTDGNGDVIVMALGEFAGGGVLTPQLAGGSTFNLGFAYRMVSGNLVARVWDQTTLKTSVTVAVTGVIYYWL